MEKDNKLIAEFMGLRINHYGDYNIDKKIMGFDMIVCSLADTKFHSSWDWLMPVIEKIQDIFVDDPELDWQLYDDIRFNVPYLDDTYNSVLHAINQYNNK